MEKMRFTWFLLGFLIFLILGVIRPFKRSPFSIERFSSNIGLAVINILALKLIIPLSLINLSAYISPLFSLEKAFQGTPIFELVLSLLLLDFAIYTQHILSHKIPLLWRFHRIHHGDPTFDTTTALRFHPFEAILSFFYKAIVVLLIGPSTAAIVTFEILLNFSAMFNHSNIYLPNGLDEKLTVFLVTPRFHRIHHSPFKEETNSHYGFFLTLWDFLFRTNSPKPSHGQIGLDSNDKASSQRIIDLLLSPFH